MFRTRKEINTDLAERIKEAYTLELVNSFELGAIREILLDIRSLLQKEEMSIKGGIDYKNGPVDGDVV